MGPPGVVLQEELESVQKRAARFVTGNNNYETGDSGYPHDGRADKNPYPHDRRADKDSYPHDSNNQCIILRLQLSFVMTNVQLMLCAYNYVENPQMIQLLDIAVGNSAFSYFN